MHVEKHLEALLLLLEPHGAAIRDCASKFRTDLYCAIYFEDFNPAVNLSSATLRRIAALGIPLDFDLYFVGTGSDADENV